LNLRDEEAGTPPERHPRILVCPQPTAWNDLYKSLCEYARQHQVAEAPPSPFVLTGWWATNDLDKQQRWGEMRRWAERHGCARLLESLKPEDFLWVQELAAHAAMDRYADWTFGWTADRAPRPSRDEVVRMLAELKARWDYIAPSIAPWTAPLRFTGRARRRLLVGVTAVREPAWGEWNPFRKVRSLEFSEIRSSVNEAVEPHRVDHIDFSIPKSIRSELSSLRSARLRAERKR
jgi:hypothetical protein